jgi:hypothetical protein
MISEKQANLFCRENISLIENYQEAVADKETMWHCHHRDEIKVLPSGMVALRSKKELIENGRYYSCPANELIFMRSKEHRALHSHHQKCTDETKEKLRNFNLGKTSPRKGVKLSEETKAKLRAANLGKKHTPEEIHKMREAQLKRWASVRKEVENGRD